MSSNLTPTESSELARLRVARRADHDREYRALLAELLDDDSEVTDAHHERAERLCTATQRTAGDLAADLRAAIHGEGELYLVRAGHDATLARFQRVMRQPR